MIYLSLLGIGLVSGVAAGMFGIGGGLIIVPALVFLAGMSQHQAIGTSLAALIPPAGLLGAIEYYRKYDISLAYAGLVALGLFIGAYFGARLMIGLSPSTARKVYAVFLIVVAVRMLVAKK